MNKEFLYKKLPPNLQGLVDISYNLWWSWNKEAKEMFELMNPYLWKEASENPIKFLKLLSQDELNKLSKNPEFLKEYNFVYSLFKEYMDKKIKFLDEEPLPIAYFCAEFGLHHSLPIYSGGLGFLAGDILKESSDLNIPIVGVGFMYPGGYVRQVIGSDGWQNGTEEKVIKDEAPIERVLDEKGNHLTLQVPYIDPAVYVSVWKVNIGRVSLYLLDTDIEQNSPWDRQISYRLYTPDMNQRLRQQVVLGVGGYAVLERLGIKYNILHLNEGHPAFALYERIRFFMESENLSFDDAVRRVRETSIFTTHTPLAAATDVYNFDMVVNYFNDYIKKLGITKEKFLSFAINPDNPNGFNMTVFAFNLSKYKNAVSKKHFGVVKQMWGKLLKKDDKLDYVTNGVHISTWIGKDLSKLIDKTLGANWVDFEEDVGIWSKIDDIDDEELWEIHYQNKVKMINFIKERVRNKWKNEGIDPIIALAEGALLDPDILTIGFARRMTEYKRPYLILKDLNRLERLVNDKERPIQIIFAGKAHPADIPGKKIIQQIFNVAKDSRFAGRIAFVEDYNEEVAKYLVRGCDVWLNNPRIPLEACGTSGMKASINGVLHCSTKDGWWPEGFNGKNGWAFGGDVSDDEKDANALYDLLESEIIPKFYNMDDLNYSKEWVGMMKEAIKSITPKFSARRMMFDYLNKFYLKIKE